MLVGCALAVSGPFERLVPKPLKNAPYPESDADDPRVPRKVTLMERYVPQPLDHTDPQDQRTWYQVLICINCFFIAPLPAHARDKFVLSVLQPP
jgi:hypothetical protein